jgi:hypothetical protein
MFFAEAQIQVHLYGQPTDLFLVGIAMIFPHVMPRTQNPG